MLHHAESPLTLQSKELVHGPPQSFNNWTYSLFLKTFHLSSERLSSYQYS